MRTQGSGATFGYAAIGTYMLLTNTEKITPSRELCVSQGASQVYEPGGYCRISRPASSGEPAGEDRDARGGTRPGRVLQGREASTFCPATQRLASPASAPVGFPLSPPNSRGSREGGTEDLLFSFPFNQRRSTRILLTGTSRTQKTTIQGKLHPSILSNQNPQATSSASKAKS